MDNEEKIITNKVLLALEAANNEHIIHYSQNPDKPLAEGGGMGVAVAATVHNIGGKLQVDTYSFPCPDDFIRNMNSEDKVLYNKEYGKNLTDKELRKIVADAVADMANQEADYHSGDPTTVAALMNVTGDNVINQCNVNYNTANKSKTANKR